MFCYEAEFGNYVPRRASDDGVNIDDPKTLKNLLRVSRFYRPSPDYLTTVQRNGFTKEMRQEVTAWMLEVASVCEVGVLSHAVNLLDRYLSLSYVESPVDHLYIIGAVCLFLASKLRENEPIPLDQLCYSMQYCYTSKQILSWERKILNVLNWDTSAVSPHDLLDHYLYRLPMIPEELRQRVTEHARMLINLCCTDYNFVPHSSMMMASGCLYDAICALGRKFVDLRRSLPDYLEQFIELNRDELLHIHSKIRQLMQHFRDDLPPVEEAGGLPEQDAVTLKTTAVTPNDVSEVMELEMQGC